MRRLLIGLTALALLTLTAAALATPAATVTVRIVKGGFSPSSVTIGAGDAVTWVNRDTVPHQVVASNGAFASPVLPPGRSYTFTFEAAGTYRYRDALEPSERGVVAVKGPPPSVSLGATAPILVYGGETHIGGVVSSRRPGERVTIWAQPYGQGSFAQLAVVTTGAGGVFDVVTRPAILTNYHAQYRRVNSQPVTVQVRPKITLLPGRRGYLLARVSAPRSYARHWVYLQIRSRFGQWVSVRRLTLGRHSGRLFRVRPRVPTTYRVFMTVNQAGPGYLDSWSGTQTVRPRR